MGTFVKKALSTFTRPVEVFHNGESLGELDVTFKHVTQTEMEAMSALGDIDTCRKVVVAVGDIPVDGTDQKLTGADALKFALDDAAVVSACFAAFLESMKGGNFRGRGSRKRS